MSHDPSEIIPICWFDAQETFIVFLWKPWFIFPVLLISLIMFLADKTSQVTYVTIVPWEWERDAASSRGRYGNAFSMTGVLKHEYKHPMHLTLAGGHLWRKLMSICEHKRAPVEHIILFFSRGTDRNARSMAQRRSVSFPFSGNYGYIRNLRRSLPKGTSTLRPLGVAMGTLCPRRHAEGKSVQKLDS